MRQRMQFAWPKRRKTLDGERTLTQKCGKAERQSVTSQTTQSWASLAKWSFESLANWKIHCPETGVLVRKCLSFDQPRKETGKEIHPKVPLRLCKQRRSVYIHQGLSSIVLALFKTRCWLSLTHCWKNCCQHALFLRELKQGSLQFL